MVYTPKAICPYGKLNNEAFETKARLVQTNLSGSEFGLVMPSPSAVLPLVDQYKVYLLEASERNYKNVGPARILKKEIFTLLKQQCVSVNGIANGYAPTIVNSGFELSKEPEPSPIPAEGKIIKVSPLRDGQVIVRIKGIKFRDFYEIKTTGPNYKNIETVVHTKAKLSGLPLNVDLKVVVRGVNGKGPGEWSEPVVFVATKVDESGSSNQ